MRKLKAKVIPIQDTSNDVTWFLTSDNAFDDKSKFKVKIVDQFLRPCYSNYNGYISKEQNDCFFNGNPSEILILKECKVLLCIIKPIILEFLIEFINTKSMREYALLYDFRQIGKWFYSIPKNINVYLQNHVDDKKKYIDIWLWFTELHDTRGLILKQLLELKMFDFNEYSKVSL